MKRLGLDMIGLEMIGLEVIGLEVIRLEIIGSHKKYSLIFHQSFLYIQISFISKTFFLSYTSFLL